jgi:hypothetical protein
VAERRRDVLQHRIDRFEGGAGGNDQERRCNERLGDDNAGEAVGDVAQHMPQRRIGAEEEQQQHAARERRQRQRQLHEHADDAHGAAIDAGERVAERYAAKCDQQRRDGGAGKRHHRRVDQGRDVRPAPIRPDHLTDAGKERGGQVDDQ